MVKARMYRSEHLLNGRTPTSIVLALGLSMTAACAGDDQATTTATTSTQGTSTGSDSDPTTVASSTGEVTTSGGTGTTGTSSTSSATSSTSENTTTTGETTSGETTTGESDTDTGITGTGTDSDSGTDSDTDTGGCVSDEECGDDDVCNGLETCVDGSCVAGEPLACDDATYCNGVEACDPVDGCVPGIPLELDDGIGCTVDSCDEDTDEIIHEPDDGLCDGDICSVGVCDPDADCQFEDNPDLVCLTGDPDPKTVFDTIESTYYYTNNLCNQIWHAQSDRMLTGYYNVNGHWNYPAGSGDYPAAPDNDPAKNYCRLVQVPATSTVITGLDRFPAAAADIEVGTIDPVTGVLSGFETAVFSDSFAGQCNLQSSSATEFLCFTGSDIRVYTTNEGSPALDYVETITLSQAPDVCDGSCWGGTFAWDGAYYYMPRNGGSNGGTQYHAYDPGGTFVGTYTAAGPGTINSLYFDWSVGRYTTHDGYGGRGGGDTYTWLNGQNPSGDSQVYGPASPDHD